MEDERSRAEIMRVHGRLSSLLGVGGKSASTIACVAVVPKAGALKIGSCAAQVDRE